MAIGNLHVVPILPGYSKIENTVRYFGIDRRRPSFGRKDRDL